MSSQLEVLYAARRKRKHAHRWIEVDHSIFASSEAQPGIHVCDLCGLTPADYEARQRRGKSAARLGKDQERAFEKEHGPRKIGEFGDPVDHIGSFGKYQAKSTRRPVSTMLRNIDRMDGIYLDKVPLLVQRFVRHGVRTETFITLRLSDWQALHGRDEP